MATRGAKCGVLAVFWVLLLQFYLVNADEFVDDCVDGKTGGGVDLQLTRDVAAVGGDGVYREAQFVGNLLAGHTLGNAGDNLPLALRELLGAVFGGVYVLFSVACAIVSDVLFGAFHGGNEERILHGAVNGEVILAVDDIEERGV